MNPRAGSRKDARAKCLPACRQPRRPRESGGTVNPRAGSRTNARAKVPAGLSAAMSSPRKRGPSVFAQTTLDSRLRGNDECAQTLSAECRVNWDQERRRTARRQYTVVASTATASPSSFLTTDTLNVTSPPNSSHGARAMLAGYRSCMTGSGSTRLPVKLLFADPLRTSDPC